MPELGLQGGDSAPDPSGPGRISEGGAALGTPLPRYRIPPRVEGWGQGVGGRKGCRADSPPSASSAAGIFFLIIEC